MTLSLVDGVIYIDNFFFLSDEIKLAKATNLMFVKNIFFYVFDYRSFTDFVTWLILPVVICLPQGLSHACLSINILYCETAYGSLYQQLLI